MFLALMLVTVNSNAKLPKHVKESLIYIHAYDENGVSNSGGSGVIVSSNDRGTFLVSAKHICDGAKKEKKKNKDGRWLVAEYRILHFHKVVNKKLEKKKYPAQIVKIDQNNDLCLMYTMHRNFTPTKIKYKLTKIGQRVYSYSNPANSYGILTTGKFLKPIWVDDQSLYYSSVKIAPGSSGSGLYDKDHNLIGITVITDTHGNSYAVPSPILKVFLAGVNE